MLLVDVTIVQVALPTMHRVLDASFSDLQWVIDAYGLSLSAVLLTTGALADRFGRQRLFAFGTALFAMSSLVCGLSSTPTMLIAARAVQGIGGAAMFATSLALIAQEFHGAARATAIAAWGSTVGAAVAVGPLLGGAITSGIGWEWIFFVNVPIGAVTLAVVIWRIPNVRDPGARRVDFAGLATFSGALLLMLLAMVRGAGDGWTSPMILGLFASSAFLFALFVVVELAQERPMLDLSLFSKPSFTGVSVATFAIGVGMFGLLPYLTFYLQNYLGYSPFMGGVYLLPATVMAFAVPLATKSVSERIPPAAALGGGLAIVTVGITLMAGLSTSSTWTALLAGMILAGIGMGISNPAIARVALGVVTHERSGMASGISNTFRVAGQATGVALLGALFRGRLGTVMADRLGHNVPGLAVAVAAGGPRVAARAASGVGATGQHAVAAASAGFVAGTNHILVIAPFIVGLGAVLALVLVRKKDFVPGPGTAGTAQVTGRAQAAEGARPERSPGSRAQ